MKIKISGAPQTQFLTPLAGSFADLSCGVISQSSAGSFSYPAPAPATTRLLSWALFVLLSSLLSTSRFCALAPLPSRSKIPTSCTFRCRTNAAFDASPF